MTGPNVSAGYYALILFLVGMLVSSPTVVMIGTVDATSTSVESPFAATEYRTDTYTTGRPVDDVTVKKRNGAISFEVTEDKPKGTPLVINRDWLESELGKPLDFMRFYDSFNNSEARADQLTDSYRVTKNHVIIDIPHFSTQNVTVTTVDAQFRVNGSASGTDHTTIINYDVNETGAAVLEIHGRGTREGTKVVDQFTGKIDGSTFTWSTSEIPRNVTLTVEGRGSKFGPLYNKSAQDPSDGVTFTVDLAAKDYKTNTTINGTGSKLGTVVEKGVFVADGDGDQQTLTFQYLQNNESVVFVGNTTSTTTTDYTNLTKTENFTSISPLNRKNVHVENGQLMLNSSVANFTDGFEGEAADSGVPNDWEKGVASGSNSWNVTNKWGINGSQSVGITHTGGGPGDEIRPAEQPYGTAKTENVSVYFNYQDGDDNEGSGQIRLYESGSRFATYGLSDGELRYYDGSFHIITTNVDPDDIVYLKIFNLSVANNSYSVKWNIIGESASGIKRGIPTENAISNGYNSSGLYENTADDIRWFADDFMIGENGTKNFGYAEFKYANSTEFNKAKLNWSVTEGPDGEVRQYAKFNANSYTEWADAGNDTFKNLTDGADVYVNVTLNHSANDGPKMSRYTVKAVNKTATTTTQRTTDPAVDIDGDGVNEASYSGTLNDTETVVVDITENVSNGSQTWTIHTNNTSVVDWKYEGNNEARSHVSRIVVNNDSYAVDQFLNESENVVISTNNESTVIGKNNITVHLYEDSETQYVDRVDTKGQYENRVWLERVNVNGDNYTRSARLASAESTQFNVSTSAVYGDNNVTGFLNDTSYQDKYDVDVAWHKENRTYFQNVTINGVPYGSPQLVAENQTLTFNITDVISPGDNKHVFYQNASATTTDTLDFVEKVEFHKNYSVVIEEAQATYTKTTTTEFNHTVEAGALFNLSVPGRVMRMTGTTVEIGNNPAQHTATFGGSLATVQVDEEIPNNTTVRVQVDFKKYNVSGASETLRSEGPLGDPYKVEVGLSSISSDVWYNITQYNLSSPEWEVILTKNGNLYLETEDVFTTGNARVNQSEFNSTISGIRVQRPQWSSDTFTGVVNVIKPDVQVNPDKDVRHKTPLFSDGSVTYERMSEYTVRKNDQDVTVEWRETGPYHYSWEVTSPDDEFDQVLQGVDSEGVTVFRNGERYEDISRNGSELVIKNISGSFYDVYTYDFPVVNNGTSVSISPGETKRVKVAVYNPNDFALHNVRLDVPHGWVVDISPQYHTIGSGGTEVYVVRIHVPEGTASATYELDMGVHSSETGQVELTSMSVSVGEGFADVTGAAFSPLLMALTALGAFAGISLLLMWMNGTPDWVEGLKEDLPG